MSKEGATEFGGRMGRPKFVQEARLRGDSSTLSVAGKKGAEETNRIKAEKKEKRAVFDQIAEEKRVADEVALRESTNEHLLTPDGEDPEESV